MKKYGMKWATWQTDWQGQKTALCTQYKNKQWHK